MSEILQIDSQGMKNIPFVVKGKSNINKNRRGFMYLNQFQSHLVLHVFLFLQ